MKQYWKAATLLYLIRATSSLSTQSSSQSPSSRDGNSILRTSTSSPPNPVETSTDPTRERRTGGEQKNYYNYYVVIVHLVSMHIMQMHTILLTMMLFLLLLYRTVYRSWHSTTKIKTKETKETEPSCSKSRFHFAALSFCTKSQSKVDEWCSRGANRSDANCRIMAWAVQFKSSGKTLSGARCGRRDGDASR